MVQLHCTGRVVVCGLVFAVMLFSLNRCETFLPIFSFHPGPSCSKALDSAIHRINNLYPVDNAVGFPNTNPLK